MNDDQFPTTSSLDADVVRAIEAIVLVATEPVPTDQLAKLLEQSLTVIDQLCHQLADAYDQAGHGFQLAKVAGGWRYQTHPDLSPYVERFLLDGQRSRMSGAALETLAIIAYKQPILRADVEAIRGVACGETIRSLMEKHLVKIAGRAEEPGRPILYGTTKRFLELFGLNSLKDLEAKIIELRGHAARIGRAEPIDIHQSLNDGHADDALSDISASVRDLSGLGVGWGGWQAAAKTVAEAKDEMRRFADAVIAKAPG